MSTKFLLLVFFAASACAQSPFEEGISVSGEVRGASPGTTSDLYVDLYSLRTHSSAAHTTLDINGRFEFDHVPAGDYSIRVVTGPGSDPIVEQTRQLSQYSSPLTLELPASSVTKPPSGTVSIQQLQHPIPKKAVQAFREAQKYSEAQDTSNAIAKLEEAIRMAPQFREAHINLGVQYARSGRYPEALAELHTALDIGPPEAMVYANLAWVHAKLQQRPEAENFARKALSLDPGNASARYLLQRTLAQEK